MTPPYTRYVFAMYVRTQTDSGGFIIFEITGEREKKISWEYMLPISWLKQCTTLRTADESWTKEVTVFL